MAAPFYSQADQDIYASGNKFIPQEQYRLGPYTPPEIMGQNTNAGITATGAANPYKWPYPWLTGDGGAGNVSGTQQRSWSPNQNLGPTNITDYEAEAAGVGSTWGGSLARLKDLYSRLPTPGNLLMKGIRRWKENREIKKEQERIAEDRTGIGDHDRGTFEGPHPDRPTKTPEQGGWHPGVGGGGQPHGTDTSGDFAGKGSGNPFGRAQGGRIGYRNGEFVDEDINVEGPGFDVNENLMASDPNAMDSLNEMSMQIFGKGVHELSEEEYQMLIDMANNQVAGPEQDQGLASLV